MSNVNLNEQQLEAVNIVNGPVMVFAGAGTGKTRTLISRIVNLIENNQHETKKNLIILCVKTNID